MVPEGGGKEGTEVGKGGDSCFLNTDSSSWGLIALRNGYLNSALPVLIKMKRNEQLPLEAQRWSVCFLQELRLRPVDCPWLSR